MNTKAAILEKAEDLMRFEAVSSTQWREISDKIAALVEQAITAERERIRAGIEAEKQNSVWPTADVYNSALDAAIAVVDEEKEGI
jgi:hypothetical protein